MEIEKNKKITAPSILDFRCSFNNNYFFYSVISSKIFLTVSDSLVSTEITSAEEREKTFSEMIELALETAIRI